jgi:hypothetical protein
VQPARRSRRQRIAGVFAAAALALATFAAPGQALAASDTSSPALRAGNTTSVILYCGGASWDPLQWIQNTVQVGGTVSCTGIVPVISTRVSVWIDGGYYGHNGGKVSNGLPGTTDAWLVPCYPGTHTYRAAYDVTVSYPPGYWPAQLSDSYLSMVKTITC